jgi:hypothetical protein
MAREWWAGRLDFFFVVGLVSLPMIHDLVKLGPIPLPPAIDAPC